MPVVWRAADDHYYLSISPSQFGGMGTGAPMYYGVQQYDDAIEISYLMLYAYQGGQTCRALRLASQFNCIVETGAHRRHADSAEQRPIPRSPRRL